MNEHVTFFGVNGSTTEAQTHRCTVAVGPEEKDLYVATRGRHNNLLGSEASFGDRRDYAGFLQDLRDRVRDTGGGVVVEVDGRSSEVTFHSVGTGSGPPPNFLLRLVPGGGTDREEIREDPQRLRLNRWEHLVVPVNRRAGEQLGQLRSLLKELSPAVETLLLDTLRNPSLEVRLSRVEECLDLASPRTRGTSTRPAGEGDRSRWRWGDLLNPKSWRVGWVATVASVLAVLVFLFWLWAQHRWFFEDRTGEAPVAQTVSVSDATPETGQQASAEDGALEGSGDEEQGGEDPRDKQPAKGEGQKAPTGSDKRTKQMVPEKP